METDARQSVVGAKRAAVDAAATHDHVKALGREGSEFCAIRLSVKCIVHQTVVWKRDRIEIVKHFRLIREHQRAIFGRSSSFRLDEWNDSGALLSADNPRNQFGRLAVAKTRETDLRLANEHVVEIEVPEREHGLR